MSRFTVMDENVMPVDCDPKLFALTFELRAQRHDVERTIENVKKALELSRKRLSLNKAELDAIEGEMKEIVDKLEAHLVSVPPVFGGGYVDLRPFRNAQIKKLSKLNQVETTVVLKKSQMNKIHSWTNSVLVCENVMQVLANRVTELKKETELIERERTNGTTVAKQLRAEINAMKQVLKNHEVAIRDEMLKKFNVETDWSFVDDMEMAIINYMIVQANSPAEMTKERFAKETKSLMVTTRRRVLGTNGISILSRRLVFRTKSGPIRTF